MAPANLSARYARHIVLKGVGGSGQQRLLRASVLVIGAGGLGSPLIAYLAAAGIGTIGIADDDEIALSNLQRQIIHRTDAIGSPKAESAARFAKALNPEIILNTHRVRVDQSNIDGLLAPYDLVADGSDNLATRQIVAASATRLEKPLISGAVSMFDGQVTVFLPFEADADGLPNPGFADLYPETPDDKALPSCEQVGILGAVTGVIGTLMAMEVVKLVTRIGEPLVGRLLLYDGKAARFTEIAYKRS